MIIRSSREISDQYFLRCRRRSVHALQTIILHKWILTHAAPYRSLTGCVFSRINNYSRNAWSTADGKFLSMRSRSRAPFTSHKTFGDAKRPHNRRRYATERTCYANRTSREKHATLFTPAELICMRYAANDALLPLWKTVSCTPANDVNGW